MSSTQPMASTQGWGGDEPAQPPAAAASAETPEDWLAERFADEFGATDGTFVAQPGAQPQRASQPESVGDELAAPTALDGAEAPLNQAHPLVIMDVTRDAPADPPPAPSPAPSPVPSAVPPVPGPPPPPADPTPVDPNPDTLAPGLLLVPGQTTSLDSARPADPARPVDSARPGEPTSVRPPVPAPPAPVVSAPPVPAVPVPPAPAVAAPVAPAVVAPASIPAVPAPPAAAPLAPVPVVPVPPVVRQAPPPASTPPVRPSVPQPDVPQPAVPQPSLPQPSAARFAGASSTSVRRELSPTAIVDAVSQTVKGMRATIELVTIAFLAEGHILIEDVPGVGKTTMAKALAAAVSADAGRIQFTPDVLPSDIVGVNIFRADQRDFDFIPGPVFANIVIADEINRASPKTQSALLEAMQEGQVTVEGTTHPLSHPFIVLATQNPIEMDGTYPLPEAQRDRFMMRVSMGYPDHDHEVAMLDAQEFADPLVGTHAVATLDQVRELITAVRGLYAAPAIKRYIVSLAQATRDDPELALGASPRACLQLLRAAKAAAALDGRDFVLPDDVQHLAGHVWGHRLIRRRAGAGQLDGLEYMRRLVARVKVG